MGNLKIKLKVIGKNLQCFISALQNKNINIYDLKEKETESDFLIDYADKHKFFAICKNMCYNVKIMGYKGVYSPIMYIYSNLSLVLAFIVFVCIFAYTDNFIYSIDYLGSGSLVSNKSQTIINNYGVKLGNSFNSVNFNELSSKLLLENERLSFVTVKKDGNTLVINSVLNNVSDSSVTKSYKNVVSDKDGVIDKISVLRGTTSLKVGDSVKVGDILISANMIGKDEKIYPCNIIGSVSIEYTKKQTYSLFNYTEDTIKNLVSCQKFLEKDEVVSYKILEKKDKVIIEYTLKRTYYGGNS